MKKSAILILTPILALSAASAIATPRPARSYLYSLSGKNGEIKKVGSDEYILGMTLPKVHPITMFTDRPYRVTKSISGHKMKVIWKTGGNNSFTANPPNAVLEVGGMQSMIVTLTGFQFNHNRALYAFSPIPARSTIPKKDMKAHNLSVNITID